MEVVIADSNEVYIQRLIHYMNKKFKDYHVQALTTKQAFNEYLLQGTCEVVLFASDFYEEGMPIKNAKLPIVLLENDEIMPSIKKVKRSINKYTRISELVRYINASYEEVERNQPVIYGIYSPAGGVGKSTIAMALALGQTQQDKKTLYFNLEDLDSTGMFLEGRKSTSVTVGDEVNLTAYERMVNRMIQKDEKTNLMYLEKENGEFDPYVATVSEVHQIIDTVIESEIASNIVIDFSSGLSNLNYNLFDTVDYLIIVTNNTAQSIYKLKKFIDSEEITSSIKSKMRLVVNNTKDFTMQTDIPIIARIDKVYAPQPMGISEHIAQNSMIHLEEKNKIKIV